MIRPATQADFDVVASSLTSEGTRELAEVYGMTAVETLRRNLVASSEAWAMCSGETVLCVFGVAPLSILEGLGEFWIVGTQHICSHRLSFARQCRRFLPNLMSRWTELVGSLEHSRADVLRWTAWMGAQITPQDKRMSIMRLRAP